MRSFGRRSIDYISGKGDRPRSKREALVFQTLFAATMAFVMVLSVNLLLLYHDVKTSVSMLVGWPLWFAFAFALRELYANKASFFIKKRVLDGRLEGLPLQAAFVAVNVLLMAPVLCAAGTECGVLLGGLDQGTFPSMYFHMLPRAAALAFVIVLFLAKPLVTAVFTHAAPHFRSVGNASAAPTHMASQNTQGR